MNRTRRPTPRVVIEHNPAARRAVRAAAEREPRLPAGFGLWLAGRIVAAALLVGAGWLVYDFASSSRYQVQTVHVRGNVLLSQSEVETTAAVVGANVFWVNHAEVAARLRALPLVQRVEISAALPDTVDIQVVERQPAGFWTSGEQTFLVDSEGVILKPVDAETAQIRACAGQPCDPQLAALPSVVQAEAGPLIPGERVDASALSTSAQLSSLLPTIGVQPRGFQWSPDTGLEVSTVEGWDVRFDQAGDLRSQLATLNAVRAQLARSKASVGLIDVRFGDRPYFR
ncbi:MAG: FtsQ-type POTRA domain-containing protein [Chloroflexi bacterium]|nr:FtsQ-type POTRA domain-containing protein [Chloroflexota bacterium]MBV9897792.1 FtsQ-type POTRA domain-containing protein [Chloroflexota bacterium]